MPHTRVTPYDTAGRIHISLPLPLPRYYYFALPADFATDAPFRYDIIFPLLPPFATLFRGDAIFATLYGLRHIRYITPLLSRARYRLMLSVFHVYYLLLRCYYAAACFFFSYAFSMFFRYYAMLLFHYTAPGVMVALMIC